MEHNKEITALRQRINDSEASLGALQNEHIRLKDTMSKKEAAWAEKEKELQKLHGILMDELTAIKQNLPQNKIVMNEPYKPDTAIIIITYNTSRFIKKQVECIRKFSKELVDIIIIDNSFDDDAIKSIKYYNDSELHCKYYKTDATSRNGSDSHSFAANAAYMMYKAEYKFMMFLDHDCFPVKPFSIKEMLSGHVATGLGQRKGELEYFWAGCFMFDNENIDRTLINFSTNHELGVDTGGMLYLLIKKYGKEQCPFLNERHVQNPNFNKSFYNFYAEINDGMFMHFINGSSWNPSEGNEERINSLINILDEKLAEK